MRGINDCQTLFRKQNTPYKNRQTLTYEMLDKLMNFGAPVAMGPITDYIWCYCKINNLPPLTIIVVSKATGQPSSGMGNFTFAQQEAVFSFDWYDIVPPTIEEFIAAKNEVRSSA
jgi:putative restriction endonuclease